MTAPEQVELEGWAGQRRARSWLYRPKSAEEASAALTDAAARGLTVAHRGAGLSYGDAALNGGGAVLDMTGVAGPLEIDAERGRVRVGAAVTVEELWKATLPLGWWPRVVPGTMKATVGGCAAMDVHGKNHLRAGSFGEQVEALTLLEPSGQVVHLTSTGNFERLTQVLGAQGLTGTILDVTLRLRPVCGGFVQVASRATPSFPACLDALEEESERRDYAVAWVDCLASGTRAGRGLLEVADDLPPDHPTTGRGLAAEDQAFPQRIAGLMPRHWGWRALAPLTPDAGVRALNAARYGLGRVRTDRPRLRTHVAFHFMLDALPGWQRSYRPHGLLQYQLFVPEAPARYALGEALRLQQAAGVPSHLGVLKRHRAGRFAAPYAPDGYSLALDFPVRPATAGALGALCRSFDDLLRETGGRIYAAKDAVSVGTLPQVRHPLFSSDLVRRWEGHQGA